jgi:Tfp pilus assembly protein PilE
MINTLIQIILSVFLISIMAFICYSIYNNEIVKSIKISSTNKVKTDIFTGILDYTEQKNIMVETYDTSSKYFLDINPSINQNGGAEYSYNFWLFFDLSDDVITDKIKMDNDIITTNDAYKKYAYIVLFYKGEQNNLPLIKNQYECESEKNYTNFDVNINIKNPLVKIRNDGKEIIVEYNNINFPESYNSSAVTRICSDTITKLNERSLNKFGIKDINVNKIKQTFNMITIVFQEKPKNESVFNIESANCRVYFNGVLIENRIANSSAIENTAGFNNIKSRVMKSNLSKLLINPLNYTPAIQSIEQKEVKLQNQNNITKISPLQVADLSYFNYALSQREIVLLYNKGFTRKKASFNEGTPDLFSKGSLYKIDKDEYLKAI